MGVNPIPTNFKTLTFDGENSGAYGVYITGEGVFNAPERSVEMIEIAGRNGAYALDKGNFSNIEVTYPAGIVAETEADFAEAISDFRNLLCSRRGYVRLTDEYNPNEYRLAIYKSGLDVDHEGLLTGEFNIVFDCKPQRYLTSGESAIAVTSGNTITNPTLFESHPMLEVWGVGEVGMNDQSVKIVSKSIGYVVVFGVQSYTDDEFPNDSITITFDDQYANPGDSITLNNANYEVFWTFPGAGLLSNAVASASGQGSASVQLIYGNRQMGTNIFTNQCVFNYGTSSTVTTTSTYTFDTQNQGSGTITTTISVSYNGTNELTINLSRTQPAYAYVWGNIPEEVVVDTVTLYSTQLGIGSPIYIDLDIGEAYKIEGGVPVSVNNAVAIPANLPTLASGANVITYDNTITQLKITPRWWKV